MTQKAKVRKAAAETNAEPKAEAKAEAKAGLATDTKSKTTETQATTASAPQTVAPTQPSFDSDKYDQMNAMVRLGAYRIVGIEETVTLKEGQTLKGLARTKLGADEMICYILALNELTDADGVKAGQKVKLPKLELRKKRKASSTVK